MSTKKLRNISNTPQFTNQRPTGKRSNSKNEEENENIFSSNRSKRKMSNKKSQRRSQELKRRRQFDNKNTQNSGLRNRRATTAILQPSKSNSTSTDSNFLSNRNRREGRSTLTFGSSQKKSKKKQRNESRSGSEGESSFSNERGSRMGSSSKKRRRRTTVNGRRSSLYRKSGTINRTHDPRPLDNKKFLQSARSKIIHFLNDHGFSKLESSKLLLKPDQKNFFKVTEFLFQIIDGNLRLSSKPSNEISAFFKKLRYPVPMSRSSLSVVSAPHTWRSLIGALLWLVELLTYSEHCDEKSKQMLEFAMRMQQTGENFENNTLSMEELTLMGEDNSGESAFFDYLSASYKCFLIGDDEQFENLEQELANCFTENNESLQLQTQEFARENSMIINQLQDLGSGNSPIKTLKKKKKNFQTELDELLHEVETLKIEKDTLQNEIQILEEKESQIKLETNLSQKRIKKLKTNVNNQKINSNELKQIQIETGGLSRSLETLKKKRKEIQDQNWEQEINVTKQLGQLETSVLDYNNKARELRLIGKNAKNNIENINFKVKVIKQQQLSKNLPQVIHGLKKTSYEFNQQKKLITKEIRKIEQAKTKIQDRLENENQEIQNKQNILKSSMNNYQQSKNSLALLQKDHHAKKEKEKNYLFNLSSNKKSGIKKKEHLLEETNNQFFNYQSQFANEKKIWNQSIIDLLTILTNFKQNIEDRLQNLLVQSQNSVKKIQNFQY
ncbi:kinetochore protein ndc80 [Anaeramoeba flamelloides]|uniref:Kinetochore protein NDC80 n=1 Tax=Anaeramoeba flamelloides TaxID=1746091 RepID=A0AAV7Y748_9EUKA|nr:kinetochore protein ndc80 [Anaeramoeba flamelloides]